MENRQQEGLIRTWIEARCLVDTGNRDLRQRAAELFRDFDAWIWGQRLTDERVMRLDFVYHLQRMGFVRYGYPNAADVRIGIALKPKAQ